MTNHTPLCLHCVTDEVSGAFTYADGSGFCSAKCEKEANDEFAAHFDAEDLGEVPVCVECGRYAETAHPEGATMCRGCWDDEDDDHYWEQRDDEPQGSHDLSDDADALASAGWGTDEDYGGY